MFMSKLVAWLLFLLSSWFQRNIAFVSGEIKCIERERNALLEFKRGIVVDEDVLLRLSSWGSEDEKKECCNWDGVTCNNTTGHVIELCSSSCHYRLVDIPLPGISTPQLHKPQLRGKISPALLELHHLTHLDLSFIDFGGSSIPNFIGSMNTLQYLNLRGSNLSGIVPQQLGNLTKLVELSLGYNSLRLENLNWLSHLSSLSYLDLSWNNITDTNWPRQMLMLHSLEELQLSKCGLGDGTRSEGRFVNSSSMSLSYIDLSSNHFSLATLDWLFNIRSLVGVNLGGNQLDGPIPYSLQNLKFVEALDLSSNMIRGGNSKSLENLSHLQSLGLSNNNITEPLVEFIENISCKALTFLELSDNQLSGSVPDFSSFVSLRELYLNRNKLKNLLPTSFAHLVNLEYLDVSNNSLEGIVPKATFSKLHNLKKLNLSFNPALHISSNWNPPSMLLFLYVRYVNLGPKFPTWLQLLRNLSRLDLSYTNIIDKGPIWLWNFSTTLSHLQLSHNEISGAIPEIFSNSFMEMQLSHNKFSGSITSICSMQELGVLDLSYNQFSGELPNCWSYMTKLMVLNLAGNNFSGKIPQSLGFLQRLLILHLNDNSFSGELPSTLRNCQDIILIDVGGNNLTGSIPKWIGSSYRYLIFRENRFHGSIPQKICHLTKISVLDLSQNNLSGEVPRCLNNITSLVNSKFEYDPIAEFYHHPGKYYYAVFPKIYEDGMYISVYWKMQESEYRKNLRFLTLIDLSSNELTGYIPQELRDLQGLHSLNLSRNSLEGSILRDIGHMEMLESLDLSINHLSGAIPPSLTQLNFLQILDLSHNNLSGKIPIGTQLQSFKESAYDGNVHLCGRPLALCSGDNLNPPNSVVGGKDMERMNAVMSLTFMQDLCISMAFGFIFGFWGLIGSLIMNKSWRIAYFNFFGGIGDWIYIKIATTSAKF